MNSKIIKTKKKNETSIKTIVFWGVIAAIVIGLIIIFIARALESKDITSYDKVDAVSGTEIFTREESTYFVLMYDFKGDEEKEIFDNTIFKYLTYYRDNKNKAGVSKLYKADMDDDLINQQAIGTENNINNTSIFPSKAPSLYPDTNKVLQIRSDQLPLLLVITDNVVTGYYESEESILEYLNGIMK